MNYPSHTPSDLNDNTVYILGTGRSLLDLNIYERRYLNAHPRTLGMNRFYMHYERLGICPSMLSLSDFNFFADLILRRCIQRLRADKETIPYYISNEYLTFYRGGALRNIRSRRRLRKILEQHEKYEPNSLPDYGNLIGFDVSNESRTFYWPRSFDTPLYHRRGSLTVAINLANILYPNCDIKLLGVDLSNPGYFYDELITERNQRFWVDGKYSESKKLGMHANARPKAHDPVTLCDAMRDVVKEITRQGLGLYCCNPDSLLVTEQILTYAPIIDDRQRSVPPRLSRVDASRAPW